MHPKVRKKLEEYVDIILEDPKAYEFIIEGIGLDTTEDSLLAFISGMLLQDSLTYQGIISIQDTGREPTEEEKIELMKELTELLRRRTTEIRNALNI